MLKYIWSIIATVVIIASCFIIQAPIEVTAASIVGVLFVLGVAFNKSWANILGAILTLIYSYLSYKAGYFSNSIINLVLLFPLQILAFFYWKKNEGKVFTVKREYKKLIIFFTVMAMIISSAYSEYMGSNLWLYDGCSSVLIVVATILLTCKVKEQWYAWIPYNMMELFMWFTAASLNPEVFAIFMMRFIFFSNSLIGAYEWFSKDSD